MVAAWRRLQGRACVAGVPIADFESRLRTENAGRLDRKLLFVLVDLHRGFLLFAVNEVAGRSHRRGARLLPSADKRLRLPRFVHAGHRRLLDQLNLRFVVQVKSLLRRFDCLVLGRFHFLELLVLIFDTAALVPH